MSSWFFFCVASGCATHEKLARGPVPSRRQSVSGPIGARTRSRWLSGRRYTGAADGLALDLLLRVVLALELGQQRVEVVVRIALSAALLLGLLAGLGLALGVRAFDALLLGGRLAFVAFAHDEDDDATVSEQRAD